MRTGIYGIASNRQVLFPDSAVFSVVNDCYVHIGFEKPKHRIQQSCFWDDERGFYGAHGVWLNAPFLNWANRSHAEEIKKVTSTPEAFAAVEGPLQAVHWDDSKKTLLVHGDFARQHPLFWASRGSGVYFAHRLDVLISLLRLNGHDVESDIEGAAMLLTYGSILGDQTLLKDIQKLMPGHSLIWTPQGMLVREREPLAQLTRDITDENIAVAHLDEAFDVAVGQMVRANDHASCNHHNLLSGGLDSRLVALATAQHCSNERLSTLCFSASGVLDESISEDVAKDQGWRHQHHDLGDGAYMMDLSSVLHYDGCINYLASAHHFAALNAAGLNRVGMLGSGQGGEFFTDKHPWRYSGEQMLNSLELYSGVRSHAIQSGLKAWAANPEAQRFKMINRGFVYTNSAAYSTLDHGVLCAPIVSSHMVKLALRLDKNLLKKQRVYLKWIESKYPQATEHIWERYRAKPILGPLLRISQFKAIWQARLRRIFNRPSQHSMSPLDHWLECNDQINAFYEETFMDLRPWLKHYSGFEERVKADFPGMNATNKASVLTLLKATEQYLGA